MEQLQRHEITPFAKWNSNELQIFSQNSSNVK